MASNGVHSVFRLICVGIGMVCVEIIVGNCRLAYASRYYTRCGFMFLVAHARE